MSYRTNNLKDIGSDRWLSSGQSNLGDALPHKQTGQGDDLVGGQQLVGGGQGHTLLGHAVLTCWQIDIVKSGLNSDQQVHDDNTI